MDPETKSILIENLRISRENNEMLLGLVKYQKQQKIYKIFYWSIIIIVTIASFYFVEPYLGNIMNLYTGGAGDMTNLSDITKALGNQQQSQQDILNTLNQ